MASGSSKTRHQEPCKLDLLMYAMDNHNKVSEAHVIEAFHVLARESLAEAEQDGLIDEAFLQEATAEELTILGPARV